MLSLLSSTPAICRSSRGPFPASAELVFLRLLAAGPTVISSPLCVRLVTRSSSSSWSSRWSRSSESVEGEACDEVSALGAGPLSSSAPLSSGRKMATRGAFTGTGSDSGSGANEGIGCLSETDLLLLWPELTIDGTCTGVDDEGGIEADVGDNPPDEDAIRRPGLDRVSE